ncbi:MAG: isoprenyl transferase [Planctomycetota bacterium]
MAIPPDRMPRHIAIIMDGNGRWARKQGLKRVLGHKRGSRTVREITTECAALGIERLTLFAFSSENWKRPKREIDFLMNLLREFLVEERGEIMENDIRFTAIGHLHRLPESVRQVLDETIAMSAGNGGLVLTLALSYGGRAELADAAKMIAADVAAGRLAPADVDEAAVAARLYDPDLTDPDLLIRTGGEMRVSNYLLWQIAYSEFWVTERFWPEFDRELLHEAIRAFAGRDRRYGALTDET